MKSNYVLLGLSVLLTCGCSNMQLYPGAKQPANQVVMINGMSSLDISAGGYAVKVCKFDGQSLSSCQPYIEFLPGTHTLTIELTDLGFKVGQDLDVTKDFKAGDRYELDVLFSGGTQYPAMNYTGNVNDKKADASSK